MDNFKDLIRNNDATPHAYAKFSLRKPLMPEDDICYIIPGNPESLKECTFNSTSKTFLVIHGWTVSPSNLSQHVCDIKSLTTIAHGLALPRQ